MSKQARVTPRNIQFLNEVQVKEIPSIHADPDNLSQHIEWDPNLTGKNVVYTSPKTQRNIFIGFVVTCLVIIVIIIAIILGIVLSQKTTTVADQSLSYNDPCQIGSNQCKSSQGLYCPNGFCSCTSPYSWNTATTTCTLLTYSKACSTSNQCNSSLGLNCTNQICDCDSYHSWSSSNNTCVTIVNGTLTYGSRCLVGSTQCNSSAELTCTGNCTCQHSKVWNISACVCPAGTFLNSSNLCETARKNNQPCTIGSNQCDSTRGLYCSSSSLCTCNSSYYWNINSETCVSRIAYGGMCSLDSDCRPTLICPTVPGYCTCPQALPDYTCNCLNTQYYDSTSGQCTNRSTLNGPCTASANYTCLISLYCNAGTCNCPLGTTWIAANSTCV